MLHITNINMWGDFEIEETQSTAESFVELTATAVTTGSLLATAVTTGTLDASSINLNGQQLTISPWTENAGNVYRASGNVGIGTTNTAYKLGVNGTGNISSNLLVGGNVGIGTTNPNYNLHIFNPMGSTVTNGNYAVSLRLHDNTLIADARHAIEWHTTTSTTDYTKVRIWTEVGSGYTASKLGGLMWQIQQETYKQEWSLIIQAT